MKNPLNAQDAATKQYFKALKGPAFKAENTAITKTQNSIASET